VITLHTVVRLLVHHASFPAGSLGTIVMDHGDHFQIRVHAPYPNVIVVRGDKIEAVS